MKRQVPIISVLLFFAVFSVSFADTVKLAYMEVVPGTVIQVKMSNFYEGGVYAGNYKVSLKDIGDKDLGEFLGFCVDMAYAPKQNQYVTYELTPITEDRHKAAAYILYRQFENQIDTYKDPVTNQIAVWEIVFDWGNINLDGGNFILKSSSYKSGAESVINGALQDYSDWPGYSSFLLAVHPVTGGSGNYQDYLIPNPNPAPPVPIPASAWLLLSGLVGVFGIRRRSKRKDNKADLTPSHLLKNEIGHMRSYLEKASR